MPNTNMGKLLLKFYNKLIRPKIECSRLYELDLTTCSLKTDVFPDKKYKFIICDDEFLEQQTQLFQNNLSKQKVIQERCQNSNYICFAYLDSENNKLAYTRWCCKSDFYSTALRKKIALENYEILTLDSWTDPLYRGKGLHSLNG